MFYCSAECFAGLTTTDSTVAQCGIAPSLIGALYLSTCRLSSNELCFYWATTAPIALHIGQAKPIELDRPLSNATNCDLCKVNFGNQKYLDKSKLSPTCQLTVVLCAS